MIKKSGKYCGKFKLHKTLNCRPSQRLCCRNVHCETPRQVQHKSFLVGHLLACFFFLVFSCILFYFYFLEYSGFIVLCRFLLYSTVTKSSIHVCVCVCIFFFSYYLPSQSTPRDWIELPVLYSRTSLLIHSKCNSVCLLAF